MISIFFHIFYFGNLLTLSHLAGLFACCSVNAVGAGTAVFLHLTRPTLHAAVSSLWNVFWVLGDCQMT